MSNAEGINPARHEVERQLDRMLAHPLFQARKLQADIFAFVVTSALSGKEVIELTLFEEFYTVEEFKHGSTKVRTNVNHMRGLLQKYYAGDGEDDPVIVALPAPERTKLPTGKYKIVRRPPGEAYTPEFRYNPRNEIAKEFAIANHLLRGSPAQIDQGLQHLEKIRAEHSEHPDVILGAAEAIAGKLLLGMYEESRETLAAAFLDWIAKIATQVPGYWRVPMVRGLLYFSAGNHDAAVKEFENALVLDRQFTLSRGWYTHFLFATGRQNEAVLQLGLEADDRADNSQAQALHGIYLCKAKRFSEAERVFSRALELDRNCWISHYGMTLLYVSTGQRERAEGQATILQALVEPEDFALLTERLRQVHYGPPGT